MKRENERAIGQKTNRSEGKTKERRGMGRKMNTDRWARSDNEGLMWCDGAKEGWEREEQEEEKVVGEKKRAPPEGRV